MPEQPPAGADHRPEEHVQGLFEARFAVGRAPALAAEVIRPGRAPIRVLRGDVDGTGRAPGEDTAFRIASCTKSFTAAAALVLRRAGRLDLDGDIRHWLPRLRFTGPLAPDRPVTVRHLLTMSAGLPEDDPWADRQEAMPREQFDRLLARGVRLASPPGTRFRYSNLGYAMLGRILELAAEADYRELVTGRLLHPLGLADTGFSTDLPVPVARGYRRAPDGWQALPFSGPGSFSPIGGLFSTLRDLRRWAAWLAAGPASELGRAADPGLAAGPLDLAERAEMQRIHRPAPPRTQDRAGTRRGYGFGLNVVEDPATGPIIFHSGGYPGFGAHMRWHPGTGTIALGLENATYSRVGETVTSALEAAIGLQPAAPAQPPPPAESDTGTGAWPELNAARDALNAWLLTPTAETERALRSRFAPNVEQDRPWPERSAHWLRLRAAAGSLRPGDARPAGGEAPAELRWIVPGAREDLCCLMQLNSIEPPQVQRIDVEPAPATAY